MEEGRRNQGASGNQGTPRTQSQKSTQGESEIRHTSNEQRAHNASHNASHARHAQGRTHKKRTRPTRSYNTPRPRNSRLACHEQNEPQCEPRTTQTPRKPRPCYPQRAACYPQRAACHASRMLRKTNEASREPRSRMLPATSRMPREPRAACADESERAACRMPARAAC